MGLAGDIARCFTSRTAIRTASRSLRLVCKARLRRPPYLPIVKTRGFTEVLDEGRQLNSPNDIVVKGDGALYFTDPRAGRSVTYGIPREPELAFSGVYRLNPETGGCAKDRGVSQADLEGENAEFVTPQKVAELLAEADSVLSI